MAARGFNQVTLLGNVGGKDPEIRTNKDGKKIASFSLATTESWTNKATGELKANTEWHRVVAFQEKLVETIEKYVKSGSKLLLQGSLQTRKWMDDKAGIERYTTEIVLGNFHSQLVLLDTKGSSVNIDRSTNFDINENPFDDDHDHLDSDIFNG